MIRCARISCAALVCAASLIPGHAAETAKEPGRTDESPALGSVNGEPILVQDVERVLGGLHLATNADDRGDWDLDRVVFRIVNDQLLAQEARSLGLDKEPPIPEKIAAHRDELMLELLEREAILTRATASDEEVRSLFEQQYRRVTLRVLTTYEREEAEQAMKEVLEGVELETLARERSVDMYQLRGGLVEDLPRIDLIREVAEVAFDMDSGEVGGPVRTELGWSIFRVEAFREADPEAYADLESTLRRLVRQRKAQRLREELAASAESQHAVRIDEAVVRGIRPESLPDGRWIPSIEDPQAIVARIGDDATITAQEYGKALLDRWTGVRNVEAAKAMAPIILRRLVDQRLLLAEAKARGYSDRPELIDRLTAYERQLLVPRYLEDVLGVSIEVTREEMEAYYEEHRESFHKPPRLRLAQITVPTQAEADRLAALARGGADFSWLAREHSTDRLAKSGGDRGWSVVQPGFDEMSRRLLEAEVGGVLDPFGSPGNWVVTKVVAREEQGIYEFDQVSGNIRTMVFSEKFQTRLDSVIRKLRERSEIEIDEAGFASLQITGAFDPNARENEGHGH